MALSTRISLPHACTVLRSTSCTGSRFSLCSSIACLCPSHAAHLFAQVCAVIHDSLSPSPPAPFSTRLLQYHSSCRQSAPLALSLRPTHAPTSLASCRPTAAHPPASGPPCRLLPPCLGSGPTATTAHTGPGLLSRSCFSLHLLTHAPHTYTPWASERATACFLVVLFVSGSGLPPSILSRSCS